MNSGFSASVLLGRCTGRDDIVLGSPIAGRTRAETEPLIGLFLNTLALRTDLSGNPAFRDLLKKHGRPTSLKEALRKSANAAPVKRKR